jgi:hypothetical protein
MITTNNTNPFTKSFQKSVKAQSKKPNKFQLMSQKEYNIIKQGIYNKITDSNKDFAVTDYVINTLNMSLTSTNNDDNQISLLSNLYFENSKLKKLSELETYNNYFTTYIEKSNQYLSRLEVMQKIHDLLPQIVSEIVVNVIKKYVSLGFPAAYSIGPLQISLIYNDELYF